VKLVRWVALCATQRARFGASGATEPTDRADLEAGRVTAHLTGAGARGYDAPAPRGRSALLVSIGFANPGTKTVNVHAKYTLKQYRDARVARLAPRPFSPYTAPVSQ
jgi:hypothetical protein